MLQERRLDIFDCRERTARGCHTQFSQYFIVLIDVLVIRHLRPRHIIRSTSNGQALRLVIAKGRGVTAINVKG